MPRQLFVIGNEIAGHLQIRCSLSLPGYFTGELNPRRGTPHINAEVSRIHCPVMILHVVVGEGAAIEGDGNVASFAGIQLNLRESFELFHGPRNRGMRFANVNFSHLGASAITGVAHVEADVD